MVKNDYFISLFFYCIRKGDLTIMNDFLFDLEIGRTAEVAVMNAFRRRGYDVRDMTDNPVY